MESKYLWKTFKITEIPEELQKKKVKIILRDACETKIIKTELDTLEVKQNVKKEIEETFLVVTTKSPQMPKAIKREVTKFKISSGKLKNIKSDHQCHICHKYFAQSSNLRQHTERHYQPDSYECKKCGRNFTIKHFCKAHEEKCGQKVETKTHCEFCNKNFSSKNYLKIHQRKVHKNVKVEWFSCDLCDAKFLTKSFIENHFKKVKCNIPKLFICDHCGKKFEKRTSIVQHLFKHEVQKPKCKICNVIVRSDLMKRHMQTIHGGNQNVQCEICDRTFRYAAALKFHMIIHKEKTFHCQLCHLKYATQGYLNEHMKYHKNPEKLTCKTCGRISKTQKVFEFHLKTHQKNREKALKCSQCDYSTDFRSTMQKHEKAHENLKLKMKMYPNAVKCEKCIAVLKDKTSLEVHMRLHLRKGMFTCDLCGREFVQKCSVKRHFKEFHKIVL